METGWFTEMSWSQIAGQKWPYLGLYLLHRTLPELSHAQHGKLLVKVLKKGGTF